MKVIISLVFLMVFVSRVTEGSELASVRLGVMADAVDSYIPVIGNSLGIFKKHGLDVKAQTFSAGINTLDALTLGQLDLGMAADFAALNRIGGAEKSILRIYAKLAVPSSKSESSWKFYTRGDAIKTPADIGGKPIVVRKGTVEEYWVAQLLEQNGISAESVKLLPVGSLQEGVALLKTNRADGMWASGQAAANLREMGGVGAIADLESINAPTITLLISTQKYLEENNEAVASYLRAADEVVRFILANPEESASIINKNLNVPREQALLNLQRDELGIDFTQATIDALDKINKWAYGAGFIKTTFNPRDYVNVNALKTAFPNRVSYK
ncbi:MAG: ABC transporter substrate-binding protein [Synergistaceae bacterium]|nr:ABC transporter substrate-binding protein [Synergistaceae bacterium]